MRIRLWLQLVAIIHRQGRSGVWWSGECVVNLGVAGGVVCSGYGVGVECGGVESVL